MLRRCSGKAQRKSAPWITDHRERWAKLILDIRHTAAEAAFEAANYGLAHRLVKQVLAENPYRERAWRLAMKIASAVGDTDGVIAAYRGCGAALRELPTEPSPATRALFDQLRF
jgi:DNA-binding SARP family transcriptional activator